MSDTPIYRGYDRAQLDAQYFLRAAVPDFQRFFDAYETESRRTRERLDARLDVPYGAHPLERLDVFPAAGAAGPAPALLFIHGGYWQSFDKDKFSHLAPAWVEAGVAYVAVNYALAPEVRMDEIVRQNRAAVAWLVRNGARFGIDPNRIFVAGHSAGGHLTAMMLSTDWRTVDPELPSSPLLGGCAISGIFDLEPIRLCYLNDKLHLDEAEARRNSPMRHLPPSAPPLTLAVGGDETPEFLRQQDEYEAAWRNAGLPVEVVPMPGRHHFDVVNELGRTGSPLFEAVRRRLLPGG